MSISIPVDENGKVIMAEASSDSPEVLELMKAHGEGYRSDACEHLSEALEYLELMPTSLAAFVSDKDSRISLAREIRDCEEKLRELLDRVQKAR